MFMSVFLSQFPTFWLQRKGCPDLRRGAGENDVTGQTAVNASLLVYYVSMKGQLKSCWGSVYHGIDYLLALKRNNDKRVFSLPRLHLPSSPPSVLEYIQQPACLHSDIPTRVFPPLPPQ